MYQPEPLNWRACREQLLDRAVALGALGQRGVAALLDQLDAVTAVLTLVFVNRHGRPPYCNFDNATLI
jgi:hypothetical protein